MNNQDVVAKMEEALVDVESFQPETYLGRILQTDLGQQGRLRALVRRCRELEERLNIQVANTLRLVESNADLRRQLENEHAAAVETVEMVSRRVTTTTMDLFDANMALNDVRRRAEQAEARVVELEAHQIKAALKWKEAR